MNDAVKRMVFAATVAAALGFGATQALATPAAAKDSARVCQDQFCAQLCSSLGFRGGFCNSGGGCSCYL